MICVWLIESGVFSSAANSLDYFGNRRTDTNVRHLLYVTIALTSIKKLYAAGE